MRRVAIVVAVVAAVGAAGCASTTVPAAAATPQIVTLGAAESGATIAIATSQRVVVRLPGNPSTGYRWSLVESAGGVLASDGAPSFEPVQAAAQRPGAGGTEVWRFTPMRAGEQVLRFEYSRPWEQGTPPAEVVTFTVTVR